MEQNKQLTPRERRQDRTRQSIINTAIILISQKGAENLSLREIARNIDYSPAGLYEYFDGKDDIINAVCEEHNDRLLAYLRAVPEDIPLEQYLVELGLAYVAFARANAELFTLYFTRFTTGVTEKSQVEAVNPDDSFAALYRAVQRAIETGFFVPERDDPFELSYCFWAQVHGMAMLQIGFLRDMNFDFANADRRAIETIIRGLRRE